MSTLIRIPSGHMRFVPADKQTDETSMELKPAKWQVELVLIANDMGREVYLDNERIQTNLSPTIQAICRLKLEEIDFFPPPLYPRRTAPFRTPACPTSSLPHSPAIGAMIPQTGPPTPHQGPRPSSPVRADHTCQATYHPYTIETPQGGYTSTQLLPDLDRLSPLKGTSIILPPKRKDSSPVPHP